MTHPPELEQARAVLAAVEQLHVPRPGWEREWKDPAKALAEGWPICAGCVHPGGTAYTLEKCPTRAAIRAARAEAGEMACGAPHSELHYYWHPDVPVLCVLVRHGPGHQHGAVVDGGWVGWP